MSDIPLLLQQLREELHTQAQKDAEGTDTEPEELVVVPVAPAVVAAATQRYSLPPAYQDYFTTLGRHGLAILPGPFQELILYSAPELDRAQVGFRGPRLHDDAFVAPHGWRRTWVVIAYDSGDPYFIDTTKNLPDGDSPIWTAMHGTGTWEPLLAASSLAHFLQILRVWARIVVAHHDRQNPDEPLDDAHLRRLTNELRQVDAEAADHWTI